VCRAGGVPASWRALYELTKMPADVLTIANAIIVMVRQVNRARVPDLK